jgi:peptidoglycan/LPS O-acetylase OafA/YrhL
MKNSLPYMPRLDGLRAVAVFGVLVEHWVPNFAVRSVSTGGAGVTLFFVLSGYLITRILMDYRGWQVGVAASHFYWRRLLRLSPPFYAAILVGVALNVLLMREYWWVNALYLTNFQIGLSGHWTGGAGHFWSLCTEEQFYLLWFFVVVALPNELLTPAILSSLAITLLFRASVYFFHLPPLTTVLLPGNLASLSIGALLAQARVAANLSWLSQLTLQRASLIATAIGFVAISISLRYVHFPSALFYPFVVSAFAMCLVSVASSDKSDLWFNWLGWAPLVHIGKISYGIYVYHLFLPPIAQKIPILEWIAQPSWSAFAVLVAATIAISHVSWVYFERPFLRLKDRMPFKSSGFSGKRADFVIARSSRCAANERPQMMDRDPAPSP